MKLNTTLLIITIVTSACGYSPGGSSTTVYYSRESPTPETSVPEHALIEAATCTPQLSTDDLDIIVPEQTNNDEISIDKARAIEDIVHGEQGCKLPCWNGLTPGVSPAFDVPAFLRRLGINVLGLNADGSISGEYSFLAYPFRGIQGYRTPIMQVSISWNESTAKLISLIYADYDAAEYLHPNSLIDELGIPDDILLRIRGNPPDPQKFYIGLIYPSITTEFIYRGYITNFSEVPFICLDETEAILVQVDIWHCDYSGDHLFYLSNDLKTPMDLLGIPENEFIDLMKDPERCISITYQGSP